MNITHNKNRFTPQEKVHSARDKFLKGFTLVEILVSVIIVAVALTGIAVSLIRSASFITEMKERSTVAYALQEQMEIIRTTSFSDLQTAYPDGVSVAFTATGFARLNSPAGTVVADYPISSEIMRITLTITWSSSGGRTLSKSMVTYVTDGGLTG